MKNSDIAIIGMSGCFPEAADVHQFWENLVNGKNSIRPLPQSRISELEASLGKINRRFVKNGYLDAITDFEPAYFNISEEEARHMDPQQRITVELVEEALQDCGYTAEMLSENTVGVFMAKSKNIYGESLSILPLGVVNSLESAMAGRVAYTFNFNGPAITLDTACSSSLIALHYACISLLTSECNYAIVGGCNAFAIPDVYDTMEHYAVFSKTEGLYAFDKRADGTLGGEGGGILVLKKLEEALTDGDSIHAVIKGTAVNSDAALSNGISAPSPVAQTNLIRNLLHKTGIAPDSVTYVEAHGTGTKLGDPIEVKALNEVFSTNRKSTLPIGTVKTNIGHLVGLAGLAGIIKVVLSMKNRKIPPSLNYEEANPLIDFDNSSVFVNTKVLDWKNDSGPLRAGVSSFGIIGTNGHAILEEAPAAPAAADRSMVKVLTLSARSEKSLLAYARRLKTYLTAKEINVADLAYTLNVGRRNLEYRCAVTADTIESLKEELNSLTEKVQCYKKETRKIAYVFAHPSDSVSIADVEQMLQACREYSNIEDSALSTGQKVALLQLLSARQLTQAGIPSKAIVSTGHGRHTADAFNNKITEQEMLRRIAEDELNGAEAGDVGKIIDAASEKGYNIFISFAFTRVNTYAAMNPGIKHFGNTNLAYSDLLKDLYNWGIDINWTAVYKNEKRRRLHLPTYVFDKKKYYLKFDASNVFAPAEGSTELAVKTGSVSSSDTRQQVMAIFKSAIPELDETMNIDENGGDSLAIMEISQKLHTQFSYSPVVEQFYTATTVESLINAITEACKTEHVPDNIGNIKHSISEIIGRALPDVYDAGRNFEENGGDSLAIMQIIDSLKSKHTSCPSVPVNIFYENIPVEKLIVQLEELIAGITYSTGVDISYNELKPQSPAAIVYDADKIGIDKISYKNILITGATGFLGAHLLKECLVNTTASVTCLVRGADYEDVSTRCKNTLQYYFGDDFFDLHEDRIHIVRGDITAAGFGLSKATYEELSWSVDAVIHSAALVKQVGSVHTFTKVNVDGVKNVIQFCIDGTKKTLHHCSTYVVAGRSVAGYNFAEYDLRRSQIFGSNAYAESKYKAEELIQQYSKSYNLSAVIFRIGNLAGRTDDLVFQRNSDENLIYNFIRGMLLLKKIPASLNDWRMELTPVDECSRLFVELMQLKGAAGHTFHLMNPVEVETRELLIAIQQKEHIDVVADEAFRETISSFSGSKEVDLIKYFMSHDAMPDQITYAPVFNSNFTNEILRRINIKWSKLDNEYLEKLINSCWV